MSQTLTEKIVSMHIGRYVLAGETLDRLPVSKLFLNEVLAPPAILYALEDFKDFVDKYGIEKLIFDTERVVLVPDHSIPPCSEKVSEGINIMKKFAGSTGIRMYKQGEGIEHILLPEHGFIVPGDIVIGTDSHTDTNGALNCLGFGVGTTDAEYAMVTGNLYDFTVPESILFELNGKPLKGVSGKDIILYIIGKMGAGGCSQKVAEFYGEGLKYLSMDDRFTIANMCVEMSARTGLFPYDKVTEEYVKKIKTKWPIGHSYVEGDANYAKRIQINLSEIEPMVSFPHLPSHSTTISGIEQMIQKTKTSSDKSLAQVENTSINYAFIGSCTNGRKSDLETGANILKGRKVHPSVTLIVIPGSQEVYNWALKKGIIQIYANAGALIESPNCGPCFGMHMGVLGPGDRMISTSNRNYIGRMGSKDALIFLASPATVAASAIESRITDPRPYIRGF